MIAALLQSQLLNCIRTGNPAIDAFIAAIVVTLITYITSKWDHIKKHLCNVFPSKKRIMTVPSVVDIAGHCQYSNPMYQTLTWFLTNRVNIISTNGVTVLDVGGQVTCIPSDNHIVDYIFENRQISLWHSTQEVLLSDKIFIKKNVYLSGYNQKHLRSFINFIKDEYKLYQVEANWTQKFFTVQMDGKTPFWASHYTHNTKTLDTVILERKQKHDLQQDVMAFLNGELVYRKLGIPWTRGYLLHGVPGCGRTSIVKALSAHAKMHIYNLDLSALQSDEQMMAMFRSIPSKSLVLIEDIDCMTDIVLKRSRSMKQDEINKKKSIFDAEPLKTATLSGLLNQLDGVSSNHGRILVMTTNHVDKLDPALIRPGRIDQKLELGYCSRQQIVDFYKLFFGQDEDLTDDVYSQLPDKILTPAEVSNRFLTHREDKKLAIQSLNDVSDSCLNIF